MDLSCYKATLVPHTDFAPQGVSWGPSPDWEERAELLEQEESLLQEISPSLETEQTP